MPLPVFSLQTNFSHFTARHDKITLRIEPHFSISGNRAAIEDFWYLLGTVSDGCDSPLDAMFTQPSNNKTNVRAGKRSSGVDFPAFLFGGYYVFTNGNGLGNQAVSLATLELYANPTRFARYQTPSYLPPRRDFTLAGANTRIGPPPDCGGEWSLDGNDNWMPDTPAFEDMNEAPWMRHLKAAIEKPLSLIEEKVFRTGEGVHEQNFNGDVCVTRLPAQHGSRGPYNLCHVETYWDFQCISPLPMVLDISTLLCSFGDLDGSTKTYENASLGNGICVTVPVRVGVFINVYAKTNRRIRCEVVHDLKECHIPEHIRGDDDERHTFTDLEGVYHRMVQLRKDAAEIMNDAFLYMRSQKNIPGTSKTALGFLVELSQVIADPEILSTFLDVLVIKKRVLSLPPFSKYLRALIRRGILETQTRNRRRAYVVTPPYRHALEVLTSCDISRLSIRLRLRPPVN